MCEKVSQLVINDIFDELREENNRLLTQLVFTQKCVKLLESYRNCLKTFNNNCNCHQNIGNKVLFNDLENKNKCVFINRIFKELNNNREEEYEENCDSIEKQLMLSNEKTTIQTIQRTHPSERYRKETKRKITDNSENIEIKRRKNDENRVVSKSLKSNGVYVKRQQNFTESEKELFLIIMKSFIRITESKVTDELTISHKNKAWTRITDEFNSKTNSVIQRDVRSIRKFWTDFKYKAKRNMISKDLKKKFTSLLKQKTSQTNCSDDVLDDFCCNNNELREESDKCFDEKLRAQSENSGINVIFGDNNRDVSKSVNNKEVLIKRQQNFTESEKELFLIIMKSFIRITESKVTDELTISDKNKAWIRITDEFNSKTNSVIQRDVRSIRKFWTDLKYKAKRNMISKDLKKKFISLLKQNLSQTHTSHEEYEQNFDEIVRNQRKDRIKRQRNKTEPKLIDNFENIEIKKRNYFENRLVLKSARNILKRRQHNFTESEKHLFLSIIKPFIGITESRKVDEKTKSYKIKSWIQITDMFNNETDSGIQRDVRSIKKFWTDLKYRSKRKMMSKVMNRKITSILKQKSSEIDVSDDELSNNCDNSKEFREENYKCFEDNEQLVDKINRNSINQKSVLSTQTENDVSKSLKTNEVLAKRQQNFTESEKDLLIDIIKPFIHITERRKIHDKTMSNVSKNKVWIRIRDEFNNRSEAVVNRDVRSLKKLWTDLKYKAKRNMNCEYLNNKMTLVLKQDSSQSNCSEDEILDHFCYNSNELGEESDQRLGDNKTDVSKSVNNSKVHFKRQRNFTESEKKLLLIIMKSYIRITESKLSDEPMSSHKNKAWITITDKFNSKTNSVIQRDVRSIKKLWTDLKYKAKRNMISEDLKKMITSLLKQNSPQTHTSEEEEYDKVFNEIVRNQRRDELKRNENIDKSDGRCHCRYANCQFITINRTTMESHINIVHLKNNRPYVCDKCHKTFAAESYLINHKRIAHKNQIFSIKCHFNGCNYTTHSKMYLKYHQIRHGVKKVKCEWYECESMFFTVSEMKLHVRLLHQNQRRHLCQWPGCGESFKMSEHLKSHLRTHTGEKPILCDWPGCDARFSMKKTANNHKKSVHLCIRNHICVWPQCDKKFFNNHQLRRHLMTHQIEKKFRCYFANCGKRFVEKYLLTNHLKTHQNNSINS